MMEIAAGHFGVAKTFKLVSRDFWWPKMRKFITDYVTSCSCAKSKTPRHKPFGLLKPLDVPERPWSSITTDFIVELPPSQGFNAISVWVCRFTKMAHFVPCTTNITADGMASIFCETIYKLHGIPKDIVSDRGPQFVSKFWQSFCTRLGIKSSLSTAYHPETDGQSERVNQVLEQYLRCFLNYHQDNWIQLLPLAEFAYNNSLHASTNLTPFFANYGFHPTSDLLPLVSYEKIGNRELRQKEINESIKYQLKIAQDNYKRHADKQRKHFEFSVGQKVWLSTRHIKTIRPSKKLDHKRFGPFEITDRVGTNAYRLKLPETMKIHNVFHVSLLEPVFENPFIGREEDPPLPIIMDAEPEYEVEEILDSRLYNRKVQYLVKWKGYQFSESTWEPWTNLTHCQELVKNFHARYPSKPCSFFKSSGNRPREGETVMN
jgi:hypothetical protein